MTTTSKIVLITGASSGIGEATARHLAASGMTVVMGARRTEKLATIAADIRKLGGTAEYTTLDVADPASMQAFADFALQRFGRIDVIFNNAGVMPLSPMSALKTEEWNAIIDTNIKGVLNGIAATLPVMNRQQSGHIITTASTGAHAVAPGCGVYCASKFAVRIIMEGLRQETTTLRTTLISPGVTTTELGHDITDDSARDLLTSLRQTSLEPEDIARAVHYAITQPDSVDVSEMIIRPAQSAGHAF
jgi:NADP-dependent 3-hydroxy acid dehydrogenase YdfG